MKKETTMQAYLVELYEEILSKLPEDQLPSIKHFENKDSGVTRSRIRKEFGSLQKLHEKMANKHKHVRDYLNGTTKKKKNLVTEYLKFVETNSTFPTRNDLADMGFNNDWVRRNFGSVSRLRSFMNEQYSEQIQGTVAHEDTIFSDERRKTIRVEAGAKKSKRYFITTAVSKKKVHTGFFKAVKNYCNRNDATLLLLPSMDVWNRETHSDVREPMMFAGELREEFFVVDDLDLDEYFSICGIKVSAKQINPKTGLGRIGDRNKAYIFASPKQSLEYVATNPGSYPHALMTPGAITVPNYLHDLYMSERLSYIAEEDHVIGGVIVEIEPGKYPQFTQVQADESGSFIDRGTMYHAGGNIVSGIEISLVMGDWHSGHTDQKNIEFVERVSENYNLKNLVLHDFFDGDSISHYDENRLLYRALKSEQGRLNLRDEIIKGACDIHMLSQLVSNQLLFVKSNHDERLDKYLWAGNYVSDPQNHYYCLDLARVLLEREQDVLEYAYRREMMNFFEDDLGDKIIFNKRDNSFRIGGVEVGQHGDLGSNGARSSLNSIEKAYGRCVVGHTHSAAIQRGVYRVGTSTKLSLDYNRGPSSWTHTHAFVYPNGSVQLINVL